jgi:hypothetical protein
MSATDEICRSYLDLKWHFDPAAASAAGVVGGDGRLGSFDGESVRRHLAALRAIAGAAEDLDVEDMAEEIDRTVLLNEVRATVDRFEHEQPERRNPEFWLSHLFQGLYAVMSRHDDGDGTAAGPAAGASRAGPLVDRLKEVPRFLDEARDRLDAPPTVFVDTALGMLGGGGELIARMAGRFSAAAPELAGELETGAGEALKALARFGAALKGDIEPNPDPHAFAIGEAAFNRRLHHEHVLSAGAPELWRYGLHLRDEVEAEVVRVAARIDSSRPWREVVERLREDTVPADGLLEAYRDEVGRAHRFLLERDLVRMPEGDLEVLETPPFLRPLLPLAAYDPPPTELPDRTGRFYVTLPDPALSPEARARQLRDHCRHEIPSMVAHEAYPGHHLQLLTAQELGGPVRRHLWSPLMVEGWALYCEELFDTEGYYRSDEERLFRLVNLLWRAVRIDLDVGLHTRGLSPSEAVDEMVARLPMSRRAAEAEVRRYCAWPTYQLCYAVGRREILRLRDDVRRRDGSGFSLRRFHDELLGYGGFPVPLARWGMGLDE